MYYKLKLINYSLNIKEWGKIYTNLEKVQY